MNDENQPPPPDAAAQPERTTSERKSNGPTAAEGIPQILLEGDETAPPVVAGTEPKYALGPAPQPLKGEENELPQTYGTGALSLAPRDPHCLYAHWDLSVEQLKAHAALSRDEQLLLRIHLDNLTGKQVSELPISAQSQHAFAHVDYAGASYAGDFGYYEAGGQWKSLCAVGSVRTPVETVSEEKDVQFATLPGEPLPPELAPVENLRLQKAATAALPQKLGIPAPPPSPAPVRAELPPELTHEFPGEGPELQVQQMALGAQTEPAEPSQTAKQTLMHPAGQKPRQFTQARAGEWTLAHELALAELIGWTVRRKEWPGSAEIVELIGKQPELFPVEVAEGGLAEFGPVSISSPMGAELPKARGFWFNINAELVVYGATEPDAQLTIGGRAVHLRPDGTFSFRFALPDGNYSLPVTVYSAQGEVRGAELEFFRGTKYYGEVGQHPQDPALKVPVAENVS